MAGIASNVSTVAGISSNVTNVANNTSNINAVAGDATDIGTVASNISNVNSVAAKASLITSDFVSDLNTLAVTDVINDINTLATSDIVSDLNTLATSDIVSDLNTLATSDIVSDINTLATSDIVSDLNLLATSDFVSDLNTMATSQNVSDLNSVAGSIANVNTVAGNLSGVNDFAARYRVSANAPTTSLDAGDLWFDTTNNVMKVYGSGGFVNAGSSVNGTSNRFNYVVGTSDGSYDGSTTVFPATYDAGFVDVYLNGIKLVVTSDFTATNGTSITLGAAASTGDVVDIVGYGTFTATTALSLGDNEKIQLGAAQDLQIYHDGSTSRIVDAGTGNLTIEADELIIRNAANNATKADFTTGGAVNLYHNNAAKLATTSTGIDVTGEVQGDSLDIDGAADISGNLTVSGAFTSQGIDDNADAIAITIDSNENVMIGTTDTVPSNNGASGDAGVAISPDGVFRAARSGNVSLDINRMDSDGDIAAFRKNGSTVGSIGVNGDRLYFTTANKGFYVDESGSEIVPSDGTGTNTNNIMNLGNSSSAFKDLYLSGGAYIGGTAAVNHFDDYEEGEFNITASRSGTSGTGAVETITGQYVKIGRMVWIDFTRKGSTAPYLTIGSSGYSSGQSFTITSNLPFSPNSSNSVHLGHCRTLNGLRLVGAWLGEAARRQSISELVMTTTMSSTTTQRHLTASRMSLFKLSSVISPHRKRKI